MNLLLFAIVFQDAEATDVASQSMGTTGMVSQFHPRGTPPNHTVSPERKHATNLAVDSLLFSSPDSLERCIFLNDLSGIASPTTSSACVTPPRIDSVTPLSEDASCKSATRDVITDVQETPLSVRSGRKRKHKKWRSHRSALPRSPLVESDINSYSSGSVAAHTEGCPNGVAVKMEPKMPKLLPEPRVRYNPDTPLRISIHLPLSGLSNAAEDGVVGENVEGSAIVHHSGDDLPACSAGCSTAIDSAMPVDLTSRASVQMPFPSSASSAADVRHFVGSISSCVPSAGPVYSPVSSISSRSTPDGQQEDLSHFRQEIPQQSIGKMASFLNRFSGTPAESLLFSPSRSFWTHSFAEKLADFNQNGFVAGHSLAAPVLSPVTASDRHATEVNCQRNVDNSFHPSHIPMLKSVAIDRPNSSTRHYAEPRDCVAVRPTIVADRGINRVVNLDLSYDGECSNYNVDTKTPSLLSNGEARSSTEAVNLMDIVGHPAEVLPGIVCLLDFNF